MNTKRANTLMRRAVLAMPFVLLVICRVFNVAFKWIVCFGKYCNIALGLARLRFVVKKHLNILG